SQVAEHISHRDPGAADTRLPEAHLRVDDDAVEEAHTGQSKPAKGLRPLISPAEPLGRLAQRCLGALRAPSPLCGYRYKMVRNSRFGPHNGPGCPREVMFGRGDVWLLTSAPSGVSLSSSPVLTAHPPREEHSARSAEGRRPQGHDRQPTS